MEEAIAEIIERQKQILELALDNQKRLSKAEEMLTDIQKNIVTKDELNTMIHSLENKVDKIETKIDKNIKYSILGM